tara:strand:- start:2092 stop:3237 length:1146 start_codon:yes stop_codon:yes gene_type:complete
MDFTIKNKLFFYSITIVIVLNFIGIFFQMTRADYSILLFSHILIFIVYLFNVKKILSVINHKIILIFFGFMLVSILLNNIINIGFNVIEFNVPAYKLFFVNFLHNFLLGGLLVKTFEENKKFIKSSYLKLITIICLIICFFVFYETFFLTRFEENISRAIFLGNNNLYQTFADYFSRLVILLLFLNEYILNKKNKKINSLISFVIILGFLFTTVSGSAKGPLFLVLILFFLFFYIPQYLKIVFFGIAIYFLFYINILDIFNPRFFTSALSGFTNRLTFLDNFTELFMYNPIFGSFYSHDVLGVDYIHSSILSSFTGVGLIGGFLFLIINIDMIYRGFNLGGFLKFLTIIIILISNAATYFDWFLFWFCCGIIYNSKKIVYE